MKKSVDFALDDHPDSDEDDGDQQPAAWSVAILDDCDACGDVRVEFLLEEQGRAGAGVVAHLAPATARRLRGALAAALRDLGEEPGP